jgi:hypothetical protein
MEFSGSPGVPDTMISFACHCRTYIPIACDFVLIVKDRPASIHER